MGVVNLKMIRVRDEVGINGGSTNSLDGVVAERRT